MVFDPVKRTQFVRGIKFANVPEGRPGFVFYPGSGRVAHVNTVETVIQEPAAISYDGMYSGVIKFRNRDYRSFPVPASVRG